MPLLILLAMCFIYADVNKYACYTFQTVQEEAPLKCKWSFFLQRLLIRDLCL